MSRDELSGAQLEELAALDRILAREPVGEQHLELAALVDSVRAGAPRMDPAFAQRLDARLAGLRSAQRGYARLRAARPRVRRLAFASGGLVAAAVAFTIVISSGLLGGGAPRPVSPLERQLRPLPALATPRTSGPASATNHAGATAGGAPATPAPSSATAGVGALAPGRLVHKGSTLTLATAPATMQSVANQIVTATEHAAGVVQSSNVNVAGSASFASFSLQVPSGHLAPLIATLSTLASVRSLNQGTQDITDGYDQERARLADNVAAHAALLKKLATAPTLALQATIQQQLNRLEARIAAEHREIDRLLTAGRTATLQVTVVAGPRAKSAVAGPFSGAFNKALHALEAILAIALVVFAILLPFALTALALWWGAASVRQRARERAIRTA